jgi:hypothetical protein
MKKYLPTSGTAVDPADEGRPSDADRLFPVLLFFMRVLRAGLGSFRPPPVGAGHRDLETQGEID